MSGISGRNGVSNTISSVLYQQYPEDLPSGIGECCDKVTYIYIYSV